MLSFEELRSLRKETTAKKKKKRDRDCKARPCCLLGIGGIWDFSVSSGHLLGITEQNTQQGLEH